MEFVSNPYRGRVFDVPGIGAEMMPSTDVGAVARLLALCPAAAETPLVNVDDLAERCGIAALWLKDERARMGLGSFKALGAAYAIARDAERLRNDDWATALAGRTYVTASAGNHGLSVAAGARVFGATAVVVLAETVPEAFAERLRGLGARVERAGATYEQSMTAASEAADQNGWVLLSDSSWSGYTELPMRVMEGYLQMADEAARALPVAPTHILLQAGVGGLAASVAAFARERWGDRPTIIVVEPAAAPALAESIRAGRLVETAGPVSRMGRLDCKTPSIVALQGLARDADWFVTISEQHAADTVAALAAYGYDTTPSGAAGCASLLVATAAERERLGLDQGARALAFLTEGPETMA